MKSRCLINIYILFAIRIHEYNAGPWISVPYKQNLEWDGKEKIEFYYKLKESFSCCFEHDIHHVITHLQ
jgi:hypothetical protein